MVLVFDVITSKLLFLSWLLNELTPVNLTSRGDMYRWLYMSPSESYGKKLIFFDELRRSKQIYKNLAIENVPRLVS